MTMAPNRLARHRPTPTPAVPSPVTARATWPGPDWPNNQNQSQIMDIAFT